MEHVSDIDCWAADHLGSQRENAAGPLSASLRYDALEVSPQARVTIPKGSYEPMLLIAPSQDMGDESLDVEVRILSPGAPRDLPLVHFAPFTEKAAYLPIMVPTTGVGGQLGGAVTVQLRLRHNGANVAAAGVSGKLIARVAEGRFARLLQITQGETTRIRRIGREIAARRSVSVARGFLLDRIGRELSVPRFGEKLEIRNGEITQRTEVEGDPAFRRRLSMFRQMSLPTRRFALEALNGIPGKPGLLQQAGAPDGFIIEERDNPFMIGMRVIGVGQTSAEGEAQRRNYLAYLRETTLVDPLHNVPTRRQIPSAQRKAENQMRQRLKARLKFDDDSKSSMAPWLARAFDRAARVLDHLGVNGLIRVRRVQDDAGGSRFELGLAAEVHKLPAGLVNGVRDRLGNQPIKLGDDSDVAGIISVLLGANLADDDGQWFLRACGFRTTEPLTAGRMLVSHISMGTLELDAPAGVDFGAARKGLDVQVTQVAGSGGKDAALEHALSGGAQGWPAGLKNLWNVLPQGQVAANLANAKDAALPGQGDLDAAGLRLPGDMVAFQQGMKSYPAHMVAVLELKPALANRLATGKPDALEKLLQIAETLSANGGAAMVLVQSVAGMVLIVSAIGLPQIGTNIGPRRSSDYFWNANTISGKEAQISGPGSRTLFRARGPGVYAVSVLAYSRIGLSDPFSYAVKLPPGKSLDLAQYELLMNMLGRLFPVGVEVNTWALRRSHVAFDGGKPAPLPPRLSRSFRPFHRPRFAGSGDAPATPPKSERET